MSSGSTSSIPSYTVDSGAGKRPSCHFVDIQSFRECRDCLSDLLFECLRSRFIFGNVDLPPSQARRERCAFCPRRPMARESWSSSTVMLIA